MWNWDLKNLDNMKYNQRLGLTSNDKTFVTSESWQNGGLIVGNQMIWK